MNDAQRAWAEMQLARIDAINGDVPRAIKKLAVFLKKKEDCSPYAVLRGGLMIHNTQDDLEEAGRWFRHVYENYPQTPEAVSASYYEAISLHFASRYGPAIEKFEAHLKRYPEAGHAPYLREMLLPEIRKLLAHQEAEAQELAEKKMADAAAKAAEDKKNGIKSDHAGTASKPRFGEDSTLNRKARKLGDSKK